MISRACGNPVDMILELSQVFLIVYSSVNAYHWTRKSIPLKLKASDLSAPNMYEGLRSLTLC